MTPQCGNHDSIIHDNNGPCLTISGLHRVTVVLIRRNGTRQPLICVLVVKSKRHPTLSTLCPLSKSNGSLSQSDSVDDEAVAWLISYGSWCTHNKNKDLLTYNTLYRQTDRQTAVRVSVTIPNHCCRRTVQSQLTSVQRGLVSSVSCCETPWHSATAHADSRLQTYVSAHDSIRVSAGETWHDRLESLLATNCTEHRI